MDENELWQNLIRFCSARLQAYKNQIDGQDNSNELIEARCLELMSVLDRIVELTSIDNILTIRNNYASEHEDKVQALNRFNSALYSDLLKIGFDVDETKLNQILKIVNLQSIKSRPSTLSEHYLNVLRQMER